MWNKLLVVLLLPLLAFKCMNKKTKASIVEVENQLSANIFCVPGFHYPDSSLSFTNKGRILANEATLFVAANNKVKLFYKPLCEKEYWQAVVKSDRLQVFVFEESIIREKEWDEIASKRLYIRRLVYSYDDIVNNGCKIVIH